MQKSNNTELLRRAFREMMKTVSTCVPGHVIAFDPETQLAQVQIGILTTLKDKSTIVPQPLIEVPVHIYGGAFSVECQIDPETEGLVIFSQRCIDGWVNTGGVAENPIMRFHDANDAFFVPGVRSQPKKLLDFKNDGIRLRNQAGDSFVWLKKDGTVEITATTLKVNGAIEATGDVTGAGISLSTHTHKYVDSQGSAATPVESVTEAPE